MNRTEIKEQSKQMLSGRWGRFALYTLLLGTPMRGRHFGHRRFYGKRRFALSVKLFSPLFCMAIRKF